MNQIIIAIIGSGALTALITNIFTMLKDRKDKSHGIAEGVQLLLYDRIKYLSKSYIKDGQISPEDLEAKRFYWRKIWRHNLLGHRGLLPAVLPRNR